MFPLGLADALDDALFVQDMGEGKYPNAMLHGEGGLAKTAIVKQWAKKNEDTKIGFDTIKEHDRSISTRSFIGAKTKKMEKRVANYEKRMEREIIQKEGLLQDIDNPVVWDLLRHQPLES